MEARWVVPRVRSQALLEGVGHALGGRIDGGEGLDDPTRTGPPPAWASACDAVLAVIFALELALKLVAWRLHYWRGGVLNWLDALVAAEGVLGVVLHYSGAGAGGGGGADISMIRMLRLMRPLEQLCF